MDMQLTVKIVHMIAVTLLIGAILARAFTLFVGVNADANGSSPAVSHGLSQIAKLTH